MGTQNRFGTAINCTDGRIQIPIINWIKEKHGVDYVDLITENGAVKNFTNDEKIIAIKGKVDLSIKQGGSKIIVISGHHDCQENAVSKNEHVSQIKNAVSVIKTWDFPVKVFGIWVNENSQIEEVDM